MESKYFGYGCIVDGDEAQKFSLEQNLITSMKRRVSNINGIFIDCISGTSDRPKLNELKAELYKSNDGDCVVFMLSEGHCADNPKVFYQEWHDIVISAGADIFFRDSPYLSSCDLVDIDGFIYNKYNESQIRMIDMILFKMANLSEEKGAKMGRKRTGISQTFIDYYWSWQMYEISGEEFAKAMNVAKKTIYNMSDEYENSDHYLYSAASKVNLQSHPKRGKLPEPQLFKDVYTKMQKGKITIEKAAEMLNVKFFPDIHRIYLAYLEGRKGIKKIDFGDIPPLFAEDGL